MTDHLKPIEAGCLAMIRNSRGGNDGLFCRVVSYYGYSERYQDPDCWRIDRQLPRFNKAGLLRGFDDLVPERNLLRIDDPDLKKGSDSDYELDRPLETVRVR